MAEFIAVTVMLVHVFLRLAVREVVMVVESAWNILLRSAILFKCGSKRQARNRAAINFGKCWSMVSWGGSA